MKWNKNIEVAIHFVLWLLLLIAAVSIMSQIFSIGKAAAIGIITVLLLAGTAYFNAWVVIPRFLKKGRIAWFFLAFSGLLLGATLLNVLVTSFFFFGQVPEVHPFDDPATLPGRIGIRKWRIAPLFFITLIILFISTIYALAKEFLEKEQHTTQLEQEKVKHELNFLRSQINPHFLFNALNNLHATVQLKPEKAGDYILKLGEMLRYVLEDCKKEKVSLADEINYIKNYIFFQKQKDEKRQDIRFDVSGDNPSGFYLEPMLFIALVENAFQHSYREDIKDQHIAISLHLEEGMLQFTTRNNLEEDHNIGGSKKQKGLGLGLQNIKRRLELLYPQCHIFTHGVQGHEYQAKLIIQTATS